MRVLVVGGGGREHALAWRLNRDGHSVLAAPGNPGMAGVAECVEVGPSEIDRLAELAASRGVELVVVGPEAPLVAGLADRLRERDVAVFGPGADAARIEGSKAFSKEFFARHGIRSAPFAACTTLEEVDAALDDLGDAVVVKADGLAAGKGVVVCERRAEAREAARAMIEEARFGDAGRRVVLEGRLSGQELSVMALTDGKGYRFLARAEDHKAVHDGDRGPNTGGMGAVSPAPWATPELLARIERDIFDPTMKGLAADGLDYRGVLYAGLMVDGEGVPWILEYNCRFGDPETQPVLMRMRGDLGAWLLGAARGELPAGDIEWDSRTAVCVVLASGGYPGKADTGHRIEGLEELEGEEDLVVFHAGTRAQNGALTNSGGRVLGVTALAEGIEAARRRAYDAVGRIHFEGMHYRRDIGARKP